MNIWVSPLSRVHETASRVQPAHVISLLSPGSDFPTIDILAEDDHHRVEVHDVRDETPDCVAPAASHVNGVIKFIRRWRTEAPLLVHCWAGVSRSTATAYIAACVHNPSADEGEIAMALSRASPTAFPNTRIVAFADEILGRGGRMLRGAEAICAEAERPARVAETGEAEPFCLPAQF
ncbi:MAG: protein-tyrosine phosphatase family protein [Pseudomonadota bacterium]